MPPPTPLEALLIKDFFLGSVGLCSDVKKKYKEKKKGRKKLGKRKIKNMISFIIVGWKENGEERKKKLID